MYIHHNTRVYKVLEGLILECLNSFHLIRAHANDVMFGVVNKTMDKSYKKYYYPHLASAL